MTRDSNSPTNMPKNQSIRGGPRVRVVTAKPARKAKRPTRAAINKRLAETRAQRLAAAEANGLKILGRTRL
jgi:hypothetical protein